MRVDRDWMVNKRHGASSPFPPFSFARRTVYTCKSNGEGEGPGVRFSPTLIARANRQGDLRLPYQP